MTSTHDSWIYAQDPERLIHDLQVAIARFASAKRTITSLGNENHALTQELAETRRDLADANQNLTEARARLQQAEAERREYSAVIDLLRPATQETT